MFFPIAFFPSRKVFTSKEAAKTAFGVWNLFWSLRLALLAYTDSRAFGPQPSAFVIVLVLLYLAAAALQSLSFGATVFLPHLQVLPVDAMFSILSSLILVGSFMLRLIVHTALKDDVISECTTLLIGEKPVDPSVGIWGPRLSLVLPFSDATSWCADHHWTRDTVTELIALVVAAVTFIALVVLLYDDQSALQQEADLLFCDDVERCPPSPSRELKLDLDNTRFAHIQSPIAPLSEKKRAMGAFKLL